MPRLPENVSCKCAWLAGSSQNGVAINSIKKTKLMDI